jgi:ketosteroid isomerase-like protein
VRTLPGVTGQVVERYLRSLTAHDWDGLAACLADDFVRVGPYGDTYASKPEYLAFISALMPKLAGYAMEITRVTYAGPVAFAELSETVTVDGAVVETPECLTFELTADGRIERVEVFIQTLPPGRGRP